MIKTRSTFLVDKIRIPYTRYAQIFGGHEKAHFYIIDLTKSDVMEKVNKLELLTKEKFSVFAEAVLAPIFFHTDSSLQYNLYLVCVLPDDIKMTSDMWRIKDDFQYARKLFLSQTEFERLLLEKQKKEIQSMIFIGENRVKIKNFNVLNFPDQAKNLELLKTISTLLKSPIQNISFRDNQAYIESIQSADQELLEYYYQKLWSMFGEQGLPENPYMISSIEQRMLYLASVLSHQEHGQPLLLDGIVWGALDDSRKLNLLTTLSDFSEQEASLFISCENKDMNGLIKKKIYHSNFFSKSKKV